MKGGSKVAGHIHWKKNLPKNFKSKTSPLTGEVPQRLVYRPHEAGKRLWLLMCFPPVLASSRHLPQVAPGMGRPLLCQGVTTLTWLFLRKRGWDNCSHGFQHYSFCQQEFHMNYEVLVAILMIFFNIIGIWRYCFWSGIRFFFSFKHIFLVMNQSELTMNFQDE